MRDSSQRPVMTRDEAVAAVDKIRRFITPILGGRDLGQVTLEHSARAVTRIVNNQVRDSVVGSELSIGFPSLIGSGIRTTIGTNQLDDATLRSVVAQVAAMRTPLPDPASLPPGNPDNPDLDTYKPRPAMPVQLWHESTVAAMTAPPQALLNEITTKLKGAHLLGAATIALEARATYYSYQLGLEAWGEETDSEFTVTATLPDGTATGWGGQANRDWSAMAVDRVLGPAMKFAIEGRNPSAIEPGRYTVVLAPAAVGQLLHKIAKTFDYGRTFEGGTPLSDRNAPSRTKLGQKVCDARIRLLSDPQDPAGGFLPFFENSIFTSVPGLPMPRMTWIEGGQLMNLAYSPEDAASHRKDWSDLPYSLRLDPMSGVETETVDQMIARCEYGVFVNRFANVETLDDMTGTLTGTTRDGCFLIQNGKVARPVKNFRFVESLFFVLNKVIALGQAERIAYGQTTLDPDEMYAAMSWPPSGHWNRWPRVPMIVPPMMIQDFTFTSIADGI